MCGLQGSLLTPAHPRRLYVTASLVPHLSSAYAVSLIQLSAVPGYHVQCMLKDLLYVRCGQQSHVDR